MTEGRVSKVPTEGWWPDCPGPDLLIVNRRMTRTLGREKYLITDHQTFLKVQATGHRLSGEERLGLSLPDTNSSLANILSKSSWLGP